MDSLVDDLAAAYKKKIDEATKHKNDTTALLEAQKIQEAVINKKYSDEAKVKDDADKAAKATAMAASHAANIAKIDAYNAELVALTDTEEQKLYDKYEEAGTVKYEIVAGEDVLSSLISSGTDTDPDIWVVDITSEALAEAKYKGKEVALNKPKRGGPKKFYVYTRNPKTGKIIKVNFGDTSGLSAKINNPEARRNFASRHNCAQKKDKTKAGYWSCRLPRYAKLLGLKSSFGGFW